MRIMVIDDVGFGVGKPGLFGKELYVKLLSDIAEELLGHKVYRVAITGHSVRNDTKDGVYYIGSPGRKILGIFYDNKLGEKLDRLIRDEQIDLVHNNVLNPRYPLHIIRTIRRNNVPLVTTLHSWVYVCPTAWGVKLPEYKPCPTGFQSHCIKCSWHWSKMLKSNTFEGVTGFPLRYFIMKKVIKYSNALISPTKVLADTVKMIHRVEKIYPIYNPLHRNLLDRKPKLGGEGYAVYYGRLTWEKGTHLIPRLAKDNPNIEFHIMGTGPLKNTIAKSSRKLKNLIYHEYVSEEKKIKIIEGSSAVIMPVMYEDAFGYTVAEAFALGKPVVGFNLGGVGELVELSGGGYTIEPYNLSKLSYFLRRAIIESAILGEKGKQFANKAFAPETFARKIKNVYEIALEKKQNKEMNHY